MSYIHYNNTLYLEAYIFNEKINGWERVFVSEGPNHVYDAIPSYYIDSLHNKIYFYNSNADEPLQISKDINKKLKDYFDLWLGFGSDGHDLILGEELAHSKEERLRKEKYLNIKSIIE
jgi:hypothetical protein